MELSTQVMAHESLTMCAGQVHSAASVCRWCDDLVLRPVGEGRPTTYRTLLRRTGTINAPKQLQELAIRAWLSANTPSPMLVLSLDRNGYGHLVSEWKSVGYDTDI